jgi:hypothetical protein
LLENDKGKRKSLVGYISAAKKVNIGINGFQSTRKILLMCFLTFILPKKNRSGLRERFLFPDLIVFLN